MSLLNKIRSQSAPAAAAAAVATEQQSRPVPAADQIVDIDQRDDMLAAIAAAPLDPTHGGAWERMLRAGANTATLHAATKIAYRLPTADLTRKYGRTQGQQLQTAAEWNAASVHQKRDKA